MPADLTRVHAWLDKKTMRPMYGVQIRIAPRRWAHLAIDGKAFLVKTRKEAERKASALVTK